MRAAQTVTVYEQAADRYIHLPQRVGEQEHETVERHYRKANKYAVAYYSGYRFSVWGEWPRGNMFCVYPADKGWARINITVC